MSLTNLKLFVSIVDRLLLGFKCNPFNREIFSKACLDNTDRYSTSFLDEVRLYMQFWVTVFSTAKPTMNRPSKLKMIDSVGDHEMR